jgi:hypothetical protein
MDAAQLVGEGERDAYSIARYASVLGMMLIGTAYPKDVHEPVDAQEHSYADVREGLAVRAHGLPDDGSKFLQVTTNAHVAILGGLFGDFNSKEERMRRCGPYDQQTVGWGHDMHKIKRLALFPSEIIQVTTFARPDLIKAARDIDNPLTGYIHCVFDSPNFFRQSMRATQYFGRMHRETIFSIPLTGYLDLPIDIIPSELTSDDIADLAR